MTTMLADPPRKTTMGVGFEANRGRSGDPQAWKKAIGTKPVSARLALLPEGKPRWDRIGLSAFGQLAILGFLLVIPLLFPQQMQTALHLRVTELMQPVTEIPVAPPPPPPPKIKPKVAPPQPKPAPEPVKLNPVQTHVFGLGGSAFGARKTCVCTGFSFTGSGAGFGCGGATLGLIFGGGGGGGATGISVTGCINSVTRKCNAVCICCGKSRGIMSKKPKIASCTPALSPMRSQRGLDSGSKARRAGMGLVPMAFFHACGSLERPRLASKPTPIVDLRGGSAIMVVIRVPPCALSGLQTRVFFGISNVPIPLAEKEMRSSSTSVLTSLRESE